MKIWLSTLELLMCELVIIASQFNVWLVHYYRTILADVLPMLGTPPALVHIDNLIQQRHLTGERLAQVIATIPLTFKPTMEVMDLIKVQNCWIRD